MEVLTELDRARIGDLRARDEFFWLDLHDPEPDALDGAGELLGLHPLAVEDSREFSQRPKLDRYPDAVLLVYWSARVTANRLAVEPVEIHLHISGGFLVTVRREACAELDELHEPLRAEPHTAEDYAVYRVLDALTDAFFPAIDHLEERIDALEAAVLRDADQRQLGAIYRLKQEVHAVERRALPQRDLFGAASEAILSLPGLERGPREYMRDIGDHLAQVTGELNRQLDDLTALTSTYFNATSTRINQLATRLTVMATFFLIWTLVTGFFGQNFGWLVRHIDTFEAFAIYEALALLVPTLVVAVYFWRRRKDWL